MDSNNHQNKKFLLVPQCEGARVTWKNGEIIFDNRVFGFVKGYEVNRKISALGVIDGVVVPSKESMLPVSAVEKVMRSKKLLREYRNELFFLIIPSNLKQCAVLEEQFNLVPYFVTDKIDLDEIKKSFTDQLSFLKIEYSEISVYRNEWLN